MYSVNNIKTQTGIFQEELLNHTNAIILYCAF